MKQEDTFAKGNSAANSAENPQIRVDLHCHSSFSDGALLPAEVAKKLFESGVRFAALTDHDTVAGLPAFRQALAQYDIGYIPGAEITARHRGDALHILAYGFDEESADLKTLLNGRAAGPSDEFTPKPGKPAQEVIRLIHRAGGVAALAHPLVTQPDLHQLPQLIDELRAMELDGLEALYGPNTKEQNEALMKAARERGLVPTAGTDFHDPARDVPGIAVDLQSWHAFRDALLRRPIAQASAPAPQILEKKRRKKWFAFTLHIILPALFSLALFTVALFAFLLPYFENTLMNTKRETIRQLTQVAYGVLSEAVQEVHNGNLTIGEAQTLAKNRISAMRYGVENKDYFWIQDTTPRILMHPYRTDLNDQDVSGFTDANGTRIFVEFAELALSKSEGYVSYVWQWMDDPDNVEAKESYIRYFEPWGWIIGTGIYANDVQAEINTLRGYIVIISLCAVGAVLLLLGYMIRQGALLERSRREAAVLLVESTQRYKNLSEAATEGALYLSGGRCRYANAVVYEMLGCASGRIDLLELRDVFPDVRENEEWLRSLAEGVKTGGDKAMNGVIRRCDGSLIPCSLSSKQGLNDCGDGLMILLRRAGEAQEPAAAQAVLTRLLQIPGMMATDLADSIRKANSAREVAALCRKMSEFAVPLLENGTSSVAIAAMIAAVTDQATQKFIGLAVQELGAPPAPFAFLALGSQGRQAQTLKSDQDNALIYLPDAGADESSVRPYFLKLADTVCDHLESAGYPKCKGGMTADNPQWCKSVSAWKADFARRFREAEPKQIMELSSLLDFRTVYGDAALEAEIRDFFCAAVADDRMLLKQLAQNAVSMKTPQRLFGGILAAGGAGIDVKTPAIAIVGFARLYAIRYGVKEQNTLVRLDAIKRLGVISDARHRDIVSAFETLLRVRLWNQASTLANNEKADHFVEQSRLGKAEEAALKESLKEIDGLLGMIGHDFLGLV